MLRGQKRKGKSPLLLRQDPTLRTNNVKDTTPQHAHPQRHEETTTTTTTTTQDADSEQLWQGNKSLALSLAEINRRLQNQSKLNCGFV